MDTFNVVVATYPLTKPVRFKLIKEFGDTRADYIEAVMFATSEAGIDSVNRRQNVQVRFGGRSILIMMERAGKLVIAYRSERHPEWRELPYHLYFERALLPFAKEVDAERRATAAIHS